MGECIIGGAGGGAKAYTEFVSIEYNISTGYNIIWLTLPDGVCWADVKHLVFTANNANSSYYWYVVRKVPGGLSVGGYSTDSDSTNVSMAIADTATGAINITSCYLDQYPIYRVKGQLMVV